MSEQLDDQVAAVSGPVEPRRSSNRRRQLALSTVLARYGLILAWIVLIIIYTIMLPNLFPRVSTIQIILGSQAPAIMVALALLVPLVGGDFDLSVAGVLGVSDMLVGQLNVTYHLPLSVAVLAAFAVGPIVGVINSVLIVNLGVDSVIVTLGTGTALTGLALGINLQPISGIGSALITATSFKILGLPMVFYYSIALTAILWYVFGHTPFGRRLYFCGNGAEVARLAGIRVSRFRWIALLSSSCIAAAAGIALTGSLGGSDPNIAANYLLPSFAAVFLGSTVISPGRFNPIGVLVASYFLITTETALELMGQSGWVQQVVSGVALVLGVAASRIVGRKYAAST